MQELRVLIETASVSENSRRSAWFYLPIDEEIFAEQLGIGAESTDYRILEMELPFAGEADENTTIDMLNDLYYTYESLPADLKEDYREIICHFTSPEELHRHRYDIIHYSWCKTMEDVARHFLEGDPAFYESGERLTRYFNFEAYGQYLSDHGNFIETEHGIYELP